MNFPSICIWESDGDITCDIIDNVEASIIYRKGLLDRDGIRQFRKGSCCCNGAEVKKLGETISLTRTYGGSPKIVWVVNLENKPI